MYPTNESELAQRLGVKQKKIALWRKEGLIHGVKIAQGWAYSEKQINAFFDLYQDKDISTIEAIRKIKARAGTRAKA